MVVHLAHFYLIRECFRLPFSPLIGFLEVILFDLLMNMSFQKREYEAALVGAFRREKDKDLALQGLTAENQAIMKLVYICVDNFHLSKSRFLH